MMANTNRFQESQDDAKKAQAKTLSLIGDLGQRTNTIYETINCMQDIMDEIRGIPDDRLKCQELIATRNEWKHQVDDILKESERVALNTKPGFEGIEHGIALATMTPNLAAGLVTSFGIVSLTTMAPVLGGLATVGTVIAIIAIPVFDPITLLGAGILWKMKSDEKQQVERVFTLINERNTKYYTRAIVELNERIRKLDSETEKLKQAIVKIRDFGTEYDSMTEKQQCVLGAFFNLMISSTQLLVRPISGLIPHYDEKDYDDYMRTGINDMDKGYREVITYYRDGTEKRTRMVNTKQLRKSKHMKQLCETNKVQVIKLCNLFYAIELDNKDRKLISKCLRKNDPFLEAYSLDSDDVDEDLFELIGEMLDFQKNG